MQCNLCGSNNIFKKFSLREFDVLKCKNCTLVFLSKIPNGEALKELYSSDYYLERETYYFNNIVTNPEDGKYNENIEAFSLGLKTLNSLKQNKGRLLDVGCGLGTFLHIAKSEGWDTCGVDVSPYAVKYAKEKFDLEVFNNGRLEETTFTPNSFDVVTLWDSLEHFPDPLGQLKEIHRVLKKDGLIMMDVPNETSLMRVMARFFYIITRGSFTYPARKLYHNYHLYYFSPQAIETLLKMGGFEILSMERRTIPLVKARGSSFEKGLVKLLSYLEKGIGMEYELLLVAKKVINS